ncbi:NAD-dependent succinate-semialdehyde dehydrogenase [Edaphobacter albus]|uniref:NAD-dependent succinate-semialdehyde dehydrogenase n=1 Tax=Edaphobacter sp. 4G125 TaxID=2763071 RepID=UPI00164664AE|nr:NAD-dependent succinate-semialdehyde dehydrogenase [Edaphobacter sp. 4G125]QNI36171.1 NAD-dependent succinate-semialdehyde dehydrogenase [Edaphobacter sp. 4G125]
MAIESINPANGKLLRSFDPLTEAALSEKIALAAETSRTYHAVPLDHRALWMNKLASLLEQEADEIAPTLTLEMGKPIHAARQEVAKCATACRYYAENAARILAPEAIATENSSYIRWDPLGVILAIMPWNFPFWQVFRFLAPALMAGNVGLLKHAPNVPQCALLIESLVRRAGFPRGSFQTLLIETSQVEGILADPRIAAVTLTGSVTAGRAIGAQAGWLIKKSVLELGGSDPFIVLPSADLDAAIHTAVRARLINNGQSCIAAKRFIVHESIYNTFEQRFVTEMEAMKIGDPMKEDTDIGPLAAARFAETLESQVNSAVKAGARILTGGQRMIGDGFYFEPTALVDVPRSSDVYREELFGPVAMLFKVSSLDEAIEIANDTPFGLGASAWTRDPAEQQRLVSELQAGSVFINAMVASDPRLPFGGIKHSGYGRELSAMGMREFLNAKTVVLATA